MGDTTVRQGQRGNPATPDDQLKAIPWGEPLVGFGCPSDAPPLGVAEWHRYGLPAGDVHQVVHIAACGEPGVREGMPEAVRVAVLDACLLAPSPEHGPDAGVPEVCYVVASRADPQPRRVRVLAACPDALVTVDRGGRLAADRHPPDLTALEPYPQPTPVKEDVRLLVGSRVEAQASKAGHPLAGVDEDPDDRVITAGLEVLASGDPQQSG